MKWERKKKGTQVKQVVKINKMNKIKSLKIKTKITKDNEQKSNIKKRNHKSVILPIYPFCLVSNC